CRTLHAFGVGIAFGFSYPIGYATLHYPFALNLALGLTGLALVLRDRWWGAPFIILAALGHEVNLLFCVLSLVYRVTTVRIGIPSAWLPMLGLGFWASTSWLLSGTHRAAYEMPAIDHLARVLVPALTGGLAVESFRFLGEPYASVRALFHSWVVLV